MRTIQIALFALLGVVAVSSCKPQASAEAAPAQTTPAEVKIQPVKTMTLGYQSTAVSQEVTSTVLAMEETHLSPALSGRIRSVKVDVNDHVEKGQLLAEMDRTQLEQTRLQYNTLKTDLTRMDTLLQYGSVTQQTYDQMKAQVETTALVLENLEENTLLRAPYTGIITGKYYNDGELYSPTPNTAAGKAALLSMIQVNPVKLMVNLGENYLPDVKNGMEATITTDVYPGEKFTGRVFRIHPTVSSATRTFAVEVKVPNGEEKLVPGMFARVNLKLGDKDALLVPSLSVLQQSGTNQRYIMLHENGKARRVDVQVVRRLNDQLEIAAPGLKGGEELIFAGQSNLEDGMAVNVVVE
ncbi:MAG: efflux RND transporter periplasmic adaptor subunit [Bacteroidales bacterium]